MQRVMVSGVEGSDGNLRALHQDSKSRQSPSVRKLDDLHGELQRLRVNKQEGGDTGRGLRLEGGSEVV